MLRKSPPYVSAQHESTDDGLAWLEHERTAFALAMTVSSVEKSYFEKAYSIDKYD